MTDARPRDWRAQAKLAADMRRTGPVRPASTVSAGAAKVAGEAEAVVEASRVATATAARATTHAAEVKAEAAATAAATPAKARPWYATGESKSGPKRWDIATGKSVATTLRRYVKLTADLTTAEAATASAGGAGLQALIAKYGVQASEWTTGVPT